MMSWYEQCNVADHNDFLFVCPAEDTATEATRRITENEGKTRTESTDSAITDHQAPKGTV